MFIVILLLGAIALFYVLIFFFFLSHIILADCLIFAFIVGNIAKYIWKIHPALYMLIGIAVFIAMFLVQRTRPGFWIIGTLMSLAFGAVGAVLAYSFTNGDMVWTFVVLGLTSLVSIGLHLFSRSRLN